MRIIFFEKSYPKCSKEASPRPFYKKPKFSISLDQQYEIIKTLFLLYVQAEVYQNNYIETKVLTNCFYLILSLFKKHVQY